MLKSTERLLDAYKMGSLSRREVALAILGLAMAPGAAVRAQNQTVAPIFRATGLNHLALRVSDVARARDFYGTHLGATVIQDNAPGNCFLRVGENYLGLFRSSSTAGLDHFCFTVEGYEPERAVEKLKSAGIEARRSEDRVYFDDPDGIENPTR